MQAMISCHATTCATRSSVPARTTTMPGLDVRQRMNVPGVVGNGNRTRRFDWHDVGSESARVPGLISASCGRGAEL